MDDLLNYLKECIYKGKADEAVQYTTQAMRQNLPPDVILEKGMMTAMDQIGEDFSRGRAFIPDLLVAARAMAQSMETLHEALMEHGVEPKGKILLGAVFGDVHDIGKKLLKMTLEGAGFQVIDLGINVTAEKFLEVCKQEHPDIIGLSALLSTTMNYMGEVIRQVQPVNSQVKFMVGGAPISQAFANKIGAHGYAPDAPSAVKKAKELLGIA